MCTNLQVKKIFAIEALLHNLKVWGFTFQSKNIKKSPSQIYSFWNCLSRNLHLIELIIITLLLLPKYLRKTRESLFFNVTPWYWRITIYHYDNTKVNCSIFCQVSLALLKRTQPILERLNKNITKAWKASIIDRSKTWC